MMLQNVLRMIENSINYVEILKMIHRGSRRRTWIGTTYPINRIHLDSIAAKEASP